MITHHGFLTTGTIKTRNESPYLLYLSINQSNVIIHLLEDLWLVSCCSLLGPFCVLDRRVQVCMWISVQLLLATTSFMFSAFKDKTYQAGMVIKGKRSFKSNRQLNKSITVGFCTLELEMWVYSYRSIWLQQIQLKWNIGNTATSLYSDNN